MRREWTAEELVEGWTLVEDDWRLVGNKTGATRLGFAVLLKFFELEARFPRHAGEVPHAAVDYLARQVNVDAGLFASYSWTGRTIEYHRAQIRRALGFREASRADEDKTAKSTSPAKGSRRAGSSAMSLPPAAFPVRQPPSRCGRWRVGWTRPPARCGVRRCGVPTRAPS